jgi:hypothetical protein
LLEEEVHLTTLVFSVRPKASSAWAHRKWACRLAADAFATVAATASALEILPSAAEASERAGSDAEASPAVAGAVALATISSTAFWAREVDLCEALAQKHPKNYFAWTHRLAVCRAHYAGAALDAEAARAAAFLARSPSDRAASHHVEQLLVLQIAAAGACYWKAEALAEAALSRGLRLCASMPGHEALWQHLRVLARIRLAQAAPPLHAASISGASAASISASDERLKAACAALRGERPPTDGDETPGMGDALEVVAGRCTITFLLCSCARLFTTHRSNR